MLTSLVPLRRDYDRFTVGVTAYESVNDFISRGPNVGVSSITYGEGSLDLFVEDRGSQTTVIVFHAALSRRVATYPVFSGLRMLADVPVNVVCVSDPSLRLGLSLAWFAGNASQPLQNDLPAVLAHVLGAFEGARHNIFFGGSGGGFASLYYSRLFPSSLALAVNPQTALERYVPSAVTRYSEIAWGVSDIRNAPIRSDLADHYTGSFTNTVGFIQNLQDGHHRKHQMLPWLRSFSTPSDNVHLLLDGWGKGHVVPPVQFLSSILKSLAGVDGEWVDALSPAGFQQAPGRHYPWQTFAEWTQRQKSE